MAICSGLYGDWMLVVNICLMLSLNPDPKYDWIRSSTAGIAHVRSMYPYPCDVLTTSVRYNSFSYVI